MGKWTDERCVTWWGNRRCLEDRGHIEDQNGGHHVFDLRPAAVKPVLVKPGARGLREVEETEGSDAAAIRT